MVPGKMVPGKTVPEKNGPRKMGRRKNVLQKLFSVKTMLGKCKRLFSFLSIDSTTQTKRCLTFTSRSYIYTKLQNTKGVHLSSFGFSQIDHLRTFHTHTPRCSTLTPRFIVSVFWVPFRVLGLLSSFGFSQIDHIPTFHTPTTMLDAHSTIFRF